MKITCALGILLNFQGYGLLGQDLLRQAIAQKDAAHYQRSLQFLRMANLEREKDDLSVQLQIENEFAEVFITGAKIDSAKAHLASPEGWENLDLLKFGEMLCQRYYLLSKLTLMQKEYPLAETYLNKTETLIAQYGPELYPDVQLRRVRMEMGQGKLKDAALRLEALGKRLGELSGKQIGDYHFEQGLMHQIYRRYEKSLDHLVKSLDTYQESLSPLDPAIGMVHTYLAYTYRGLRRSKEAIFHSKKALDIQEQVLGVNHPMMATSYYYYALTLNQVGDFGSAVKYNEQAIRVYKKALGDAGNSIGNYYLSLGFSKRGVNQFTEAGEAFKKALEYYLSPPVFPRIDMAYYNYSLTLYAQENYEEALFYLRKALEVRGKRVGKDNPLMLNIYSAFGDCYLEKKEYRQARMYFEKCIEIEGVNPQKIANRMASYVFKLGKLERLNKNPEKSLELEMEALAYLELDLSSEILDNLDIIATGSPNTIRNIFFEIGQALTDMADESSEPIKKLDQALQVYLQCDHFIDEQRLSFLSQETKINLARETRKIFDKGIQLAFDLYERTGRATYLETAFYLSGKSKSLLLLLGLKESFALRSSGIPEELISKESELEISIANKKSERYQESIQFDSAREDKMAAIDQELFHLYKSRDSLVKKLEQEFPDYYQIKYDLTLPSVAELQMRLPAGMNMVDFYWAKDEVFVFSLTQKGLEGYVICDADSLQKQINELNDLIFTPFAGNDEDFERDRKAFVGISSQLFTEIIRPLELEKSTDISRLKIIPDAALGLLNFGLLLQDSTCMDDLYRDLPYLIKNFETSYAYSAGQWWHVLEKGPVKLSGKDDLLAFRPEYAEVESFKEEEMISRRGFGPLYFSGKEIANITQLFDSQVFEGDEATEKSFYQLAPDFPLIQISGHAMIPDSTKDAAFIAFTDVNSSQFDDSLMLEELYALRLNAEMVVLSACETGVGEVLAGEGIMSLGRGFTYAGARSLIMSLWEVNDASTAEIVSSFYKHLSKGQNKDAALQQAMLGYLEGSDKLRSHPYFWAAFVANGDMRALEQPNQAPLWIYLLGFGLLLLGSSFLFYQKVMNRKD